MEILVSHGIKKGISVKVNSDTQSSATGRDSIQCPPPRLQVENIAQFITNFMCQFNIEGRVS